MNNLYFACCDCKVYIDAGYRWAYSELEHSGVVSRHAEVSPEAVLAVTTYWNPPKDEASRWLYEDILPPLRDFLQNHRGHRVHFGELEDFAPGDDYYLHWMQMGYCMQPTPRYLVEVLGLKTWEQVDEYMKKQETPPAWWEVTWHGDPPPHERAKKRFQELVREKQVS
jgi:hypothetical protein